MIMTRPILKCFRNSLLTLLYDGWIFFFRIINFSKKKKWKYIKKTSSIVVAYQRQIKLLLFATNWIGISKNYWLKTPVPIMQTWLLWSTFAQSLKCLPISTYVCVIRIFRKIIRFFLFGFSKKNGESFWKWGIDKKTNKLIFTNRSRVWLNCIHLQWN